MTGYPDFVERIEGGWRRRLFHVPIVITLTQANWAKCMAAGKAIHDYDRAHGFKDKYGFDPDKLDGLALDILGECGQGAISQWMGRPYVDRRAGKGPDILPDIQVRTRSKHWYDLPVRKDDNPEERFVLVTGTPPELWIWGWCYGREARRPELWVSHADREPHWYVTRESGILRPPVLRKRVKPDG